MRGLLRDAWRTPGGCIGLVGMTVLDLIAWWLS